MAEEGVSATLARVVGGGLALEGVIEVLGVVSIATLPVALVLTGFSLREPPSIARCG